MDELELEAAKAGVEAVSEPTKQFLLKVTGAPGKEIGEILGDRLRLRRWKNAIKLAERAEAFATQRGVNPRSIPLNVLFPILDGGSLAEEEEMAVRWAQLLANAADPAQEISPAMPAVLEQLTPIECQLLDRYGYLLTIDPWPDSEEAVPAERLNEKLQLGREHLEVAIDNLIRLRLVRPRLETGQPALGGVFEAPDRRALLTPFGIAFLKACGWWEANAGTLRPDGF